MLEAQVLHVLAQNNAWQTARDLLLVLVNVDKVSLNGVLYAGLSISDREIHFRHYRSPDMCNKHLPDSNSSGQPMVWKNEAKWNDSMEPRLCGGALRPKRRCAPPRPLSSARIARGRKFPRARSERGGAPPWSGHVQ